MLYPFIIGGALIGYYLLSAKNLKKLELTPSDISVVTKGLKLSDLISGKLKMTMKLNVYNPNSYDITFKQFLGDIYSKEKRIASVDSKPTKLTLFKSRSNTSIPVSFTISGNNLTTELLSIITAYLKGKNTIAKDSIHLRGQLKADVLTLPVDEIISLKKE